MGAAGPHGGRTRCAGDEIIDPPEQLGHLADQRSLLVKEAKRVQHLIQKTNYELAQAVATQIDPNGLTLVFAEPGAEKDSYAKSVAEIARMPFHGPVDTAEDARCLVAKGPGVATIHAHDGREAVSRLQALFGRSAPSGASSIVTVAVPGSLAAQPYLHST